MIKLKQSATLKQTSTTIQKNSKNNLQSEKKIKQIQSWKVSFPHLQADSKGVFHQKNFFAAASCWLLQEEKYKHHQGGESDEIWIIWDRSEVSYLYMM